MGVGRIFSGDAEQKFLFVHHILIFMVMAFIRWSQWQCLRNDSLDLMLACRRRKRNILQFSRPFGRILTCAVWGFSKTKDVNTSSSVYSIKCQYPGDGIHRTLSIAADAHDTYFNTMSCSMERECNGGAVHSLRMRLDAGQRRLAGRLPGCVCVCASKEYIIYSLEQARSAVKSNMFVSCSASRWPAINCHCFNDLQTWLTLITL